MNVASRLLAAAVLVVMMAAPTGAATVDDRQGPVIATGPLAQFHGYAPVAMVVEQGGELTYANLDIVQHDLVQDVVTDGVAGPSKKPWCKAFKKKACPFFWTPKIGLGQQTEVLGLESVKPGTVYSFLCTLHPLMKGKLVVAP
jgi:plastocyanin